MFHSITDFPFIYANSCYVLLYFPSPYFLGFSAIVLPNFAIWVIARKKVAGAKQEVLRRHAKIVLCNSVDQKFSALVPGGQIFAHWHCDVPSWVQIKLHTIFAGCIMIKHWYITLFSTV